MGRYLVNLLLLIMPPTRFFNFRRVMLRIVNIRLGDNTSICGHGKIYGRGKLVIGNNTWVSPGTIFRTHGDAPIQIEMDCDIGPCVDFVTGTHYIGSESRRAGEGFAKPISIERGRWIGAHSIIMPGVCIGKGSVVAAGSVVTKSVPENVLVAGVPAMVKKRYSK